MSTYYGLESVLDPDRIKITQSDLASFKRDRRIWFLKTYLGIRPKTEQPVGPLVLGTLVHAALEEHYTHGTDLQDAFRTAVDKALTDYLATAGAFFDMQAWIRQAEMGRVVLEGYDEWITDGHHDARYKTLAVEQLLQVETVYLGSPVLLSGKADHIVQDRVTGETLVFDWKTTNNIERMTRQAHTTEQLPYYMTLESWTGHPHAVNGAAFTILLKSKRTARAKGPFFHREFVRYDPTALAVKQAGIDGAITDYVRTVQALHEGVPEPMRVAYPNPGVMTFDRDMDALIDTIDHAGRVSDIIAGQYQQIDPYARYAVPEKSMLVDE